MSELSDFLSNSSGDSQPLSSSSVFLILSIVIVRQSYPFNGEKKKKKIFSEIIFHTRDTRWRSLRQRCYCNNYIISVHFLPRSSSSSRPFCTTTGSSELFVVVSVVDVTAVVDGGAVVIVVAAIIDVITEFAVIAFVVMVFVTVIVVFYLCCCGLFELSCF